MGEEKRHEVEEKKGGGGGGEKNKKGGGDGGATPVVYKIDLHCEGCCRKVKKTISGFEGVSAVKADVGGSKVTVTGSPDPWQLKELIESKTSKKVELLSYPAAPPKKEAPVDAKKSDDKGNKKKLSPAEPKEPPVTTVVLKIRLHCAGCRDRIRRYILKMTGVKQVLVDAGKDLVTVTGTMDAKALQEKLKRKFLRGVEIIPAGKKGGDGQKKDKGGEGEKEKEKEKKESENKESGEGQEKKNKKESPDEKTATGIPTEFIAPSLPTTTTMLEASKYDFGGYYTSPYGYRVAMAPPPQIFSDENPNACTLM